MSQLNPTETSRTDPEELSDEELVEVYAEAAEQPEYTIEEYDAIIQEMAERFEANVLSEQGQE